MPEDKLLQGQCLRCHEPAMIKNANCPVCDEFGCLDGSPTRWIDCDDFQIERLDGGRVRVTVVASPDTGKHADYNDTVLRCVRCGESKLDFEFDILCGYCRHMSR